MIGVIITYYKDKQEAGSIIVERTDPGQDEPEEDRLTRELRAVGYNVSKGVITLPLEGSRPNKLQESLQCQT